MALPHLPQEVWWGHSSSSPLCMSQNDSEKVTSADLGLTNTSELIGNLAECEDGLC